MTAFTFNASDQIITSANAIASYANGLPFDSSGALVVTDATAAPSTVSGGIPFDSDGAIAVDSVSSASIIQNGIPFTAAGRIAVDSFNSVDNFQNGLPLTTDKLSVGSGGLWYGDSVALNDVLPSLFHDFVNNRYYDSVLGTTSFPYTFTRASNATYFDSNGRMCWADANMLLHSDDLTNAVWTKTDSTITANVETAPSGALADLITEGVAGTAFVQTSVSSLSATGFYVYSFEVKRGNHDWMRCLIGSGADQYQIWFNLSNGTIGTKTPSGSPKEPLPANIVNIGNGFYRVTVSIGDVSGTSYSLITYSASGDGSFVRVANGTRIEGRHTFELFGPDSPKLPMIQTTSAAVYRQRLNYNPFNNSSLGFLQEEQATNQCNITGESWNRMPAPTGGFYVPDPVATIFGRKTTVFQGGNSAPGGYFIPFGTAPVLPAATVHTISVYVRAGTRTKCQLTPSANFATTDTYANFDLTNGTILANGAGASNIRITPCGDSGVYRLQLTFTTIAVPLAGAAVVVGYIETDTSVRLAPITTANSDTLVVFGAQLEEGPTASSFIPCYSITATRAADEAAETVDAWLDQTKATVYVEFEPSDNVSTSRRLFSVSDGTASNGYSAIRTTARVGQIPTAVGGSTNFGTATANTADDFVVSKHVSVFTGGTVSKRHALNGGAVASNVAAVPSSGLTLLRIGRTPLGTGNGLVGHFRQLRIYRSDSASDAQLQTLTT